ncbi:hypothetical protein Y032_0066g3724 [Ancylostoma ceylanicum]|uniref:7TM chemoreceptor n=1 Tax=Ancylostoma ceylanicum TaxID=53326 RepID=A0A016TZ58_9BILA|nr:hypothetical protein Y032_0066g3724 [Ancylostoma ceylanicum]
MTTFATKFDTLKKETEYQPPTYRLPILRFFDIYQSGYCAIIVLVINLAVVANFLAIIYFELWPNPLSIEQLSDAAMRFTGLNLSESAQLGLSLKFLLQHPINIGMIVELLLLMSVMGGIMVYSALMISSTLKRATLSKNLKKMHRQMFTLLLLQTACPVTFLHTPCFLTYIFLFAGLKTTTTITYILTILLSLFPLASPLIIVGFLNDYRNHTLKKLGLHAKTSDMLSKSVFVSEMRATPVTQ